ncbi:MAG: DUF4349 domain-containing protein [Cyanobacteria bacterium P01_F01_bin.53]
MKRFCIALLAGSALSLTSLTSCASQLPAQVEATFAGEAGTADTSTLALESAEVPGDAIAQKASSPTEPPTTRNVSAERPQLIKRANLSLSVDSVEDGFAQVREIVAAQQGDVLSLNDDGDRRRRISFTLRVPQERLDVTLDALTDIGEVRSRSISTEDVSSELVDLQARLNNARKSEEALQEIMSRSGEISDVLEVSRELSNVRQSIEQMAAQQKNLQSLVRYSTITLSLENAIALAPNKPGFSSQLGTSWESATHSMGEFTTDLLRLGIWLLAYSPYIAVLLCGGVLARKVRRSRRAQ